MNERPLIAEKHSRRLKELKDNVRDGNLYFSENFDRFHRMREFVFNTNIPIEMNNNLKSINKPAMQFNVLEAYISRLVGEFFKQEPSFKVSGADDAQQVDPAEIAFFEGKMRAIIDDTKAEGMEYSIYQDQLSGGFSAFKIFTDYVNENSFEQEIYMRRVFDPTLIIFDPMAKMPHKGDGRFVAELFPMTKNDFEEKYPNIDISEIKFSRDPNIEGLSWSYQNGEKDIILVCDYYEKVRKKKKILLLADDTMIDAEDYEKIAEGMRLMGSIAQPPIIKKERRTWETKIVRYRFVENHIIDYKETNYSYLPIVFVDGNSIMLRGGSADAARQFTRPYVYHAWDAQKLKNFAGQTLASDMEHMRMAQYMAPVESIRPEDVDLWAQPQIPGTLPYRAFINNDPEKPIPPPTPIVRVPLPPEIQQTFTGMDTTIQNILGSYDAALGINNNQLSGIAITEAASQSNATAMPYIANYLIALNQAARIILDLIPKYYVTKRDVAIMGMNGEKTTQRINDPNVPNSLQVDGFKKKLSIKVEAGVNFEVQKNRTIQAITQLAPQMPGLQEVINSPEGIQVFLDNLDIRGADQLKMIAKQLAQQKAQQGQQPNPAIMLKQQELQLRAQEIQNEQLATQQKLQLEATKEQNKKLETILNYITSSDYNNVQQSKIIGESMSNNIKTALAVDDQHHRHGIEQSEHLNKTLETVHKILNETADDAPQTPETGM